jgi:uncharacterized protein (TIGR02118 family)
MFKVLSLMKRKEGMSREDFYKWASQEHPKIAAQLPNMRAYRMNVVRVEEAETAFDCVSEMWFDDVAAFDAAFATPQGQRAREDAMGHASQRIHVRAEEFVFI